MIGVFGLRTLGRCWYGGWRSGQPSVCRMALGRVNQFRGSGFPFPSVWSIQDPQLLVSRTASRDSLSFFLLFLRPLHVVPDPPHIRPRQHTRDDFSFDQRQRYRAVESRISRKGGIVAQEPAVAFGHLFSFGNIT